MILIKDADKFREWAARTKAKIRALRPEPQVYDAAAVMSRTVETFAASVEIEKVEPGTFYNCPEYGPGTELHRSLSRWFDTTDSCGCEMYACKMNLWGNAGCRERVDQIVEKLVSEAEKRKIPLASKSWWICRMLVVSAIDRAEKNQRDGTVPLLLGREVWKQIPWLDNRKLVYRMDALTVSQINSKREEIAQWLMDAAKDQAMILSPENAMELIQSALRKHTSQRHT